MTDAGWLLAGRPPPWVMPDGLSPTEQAIWKLQHARGGNAIVHRVEVTDHGQRYRLTIIAEHADTGA